MEGHNGFVLSFVLCIPNIVKHLLRVCSHSKLLILVRNEKTRHNWRCDGIRPRHRKTECATSWRQYDVSPSGRVRNMATWQDGDLIMINIQFTISKTEWKVVAITSHGRYCITGIVQYRICLHDDLKWNFLNISHSGTGANLMWTSYPIFSGAMLEDDMVALPVLPDSPERI